MHKPISRQVIRPTPEFESPATTKFNQLKTNDMKVVIRTRSYKSDCSMLLPAIAVAKRLGAVEIIFGFWTKVWSIEIEKEIPTLTTQRHGN